MPSDPQVQTKAQLLDRLSGTQPEQLLYRDLVETLFTLGIDEVASIEQYIGDGGSRAQTFPIGQDSHFEDATNPINTDNKFGGKLAVDTTTSALVMADGAGPEDPWTDLGGITVYTPVAP